MDWYIYPAVVVAGFVAGFISTLAGSGSLITLPLLIFLGLPANVANGTNRVAILFQNIVAVGGFKQQKVLNFKRGLMLAFPAVLGAIIGAQIAVELNEQIMRQTIGVLMLVMLFAIIIKPKRWLESRPEILEHGSDFKQFFIFLVIGIYGGFIQAGVGIFLLFGLVLSAGYDLVIANATKLLIVLCFTIFALAIFTINGQVRWEIGLILALGNMTGAWTASRIAVKRGANFVRSFLMRVMIFSATYLLGVLDKIGQLF